MTKQTESSVGRVAFIPGAANGIGRAAALGFAREGANLVLADVLEDELSQTRRLVEDLGVRVLAVRCDVSQSEDIKAALASTEEAFGLLYYAFNSAGLEEPLTPWRILPKKSGTA